MTILYVVLKTQRSQTDTAVAQKLDPAVMHFSCLTSGTLLARLVRPEVSNCIAGLKQYSYAYEQASEEASEMERAYGAAVAGDTDINHMSSVVMPSPSNQPMAIDHSGYMLNDSKVSSGVHDLFSSCCTL